MTQSRLCLVANCGRPMPTGDNSTACPACWATLDAQLRAIPALAHELDTTLARQTASGSRTGPRSTEAPLPYSVAASDAMRLLHATLWPWVREGLEAHPEEPTPNPSVVGLAVALIRLHGWLITHEHGHEAIDEIGYALAQARGAIDRAPDRTYAGQCDCGVELYATAGRSGVACPTCGIIRDVAAWRHEQLEAAAEMMLTLTEMTRAIAETSDETVSRKRLEGWVRRGRLLRSGNVGAVATYRVGDVLDLLDADRSAAG